MLLLTFKVVPFSPLRHNGSLSEEDFRPKKKKEADLEKLHKYGSMLEAGLFLIPFLFDAKKKG